jgi:hypothetical protein
MIDTPQPLGNFNTLKSLLEVNTMNTIILLLFLLLPLQNCTNILDILHLVDFSKIDSIANYVISYNRAIEDENYEEILNWGFKSVFSMTFQSTQNCTDESVLQDIQYFDKIELIQTNYDNSRKYIKDPCRTNLVKVDHDDELQKLLNAKLHDQPYLLAIKTTEFKEFEVYEVQIYSQLIKMICKGNMETKVVLYYEDNILKRRSDFNGQKIRMVFQDNDISKNGTFKGQMGETMLAFQQKFNFSIETVPYDGWGTLLPNGTWTGSIGQLLKDELDVSNLILSNSPSRINVVQPGHAFGEALVWLYFPRKGHETFSLDVFFSMFNADSRVAMVIVILILLTLLVSVRAIAVKQYFVTFEHCLVADTRAIFGQSFQQENLMPQQSGC